MLPQINGIFRIFKKEIRYAQRVTDACYKLDQTIEETVKELTTQVQNGCEGIDSFMV